MPTARSYERQLPSDHCPYRRLLAAVFLRAARDATSKRANPYFRAQAQEWLRDPTVKNLLETEFGVNPQNIKS